ncbi:hypothetical protein [Desulfovulcanus sp.]
MKKITLLLSTRALIFVLSYISLLLIFIFAFIYPTYKENIHLDQKISYLEKKLKQQRNIYPLYIRLKKELDQQKKLDIHRKIKKSVFGRDIKDLKNEIQNIANQSEMFFVSAIPDPKTLSQKSKNILVTINIKGEFRKFKNFILNLLSLSYLDRIQELDIQQDIGINDYKIKVWINI